MLGMILAAGTGLLIFIYISILYLPIIALKDEVTGVKLARKKLRWLSKLVLRSLGVKLRVIYKNRKNINALEREKGIIFVCNHQSNLDIPVIVSALHIDTGFVAKKEMKTWPFFSIWMKKSKCVFLDRENPREGIKDIKEAVKIVKSGHPIVIFPEGERSLDGEILRFKKGSFKLATETSGIIVPITLKGTFNIQKRGEWKMRRNQMVTIVVDEPIYINSLSKDEVKELSTTVREIIKSNYEKIK
ncbi:1-acyl-sn-glycerol-3-phosphate acyltransferase [Fusobacterium necrogenes]|uniref:1-acyl-sn-glycerol-3-phosphate acyltransferase n=1 Tax=Fusobacterium necrogenes TaxID=858 RepID=A0A377GZM8_9FUSO|nr:lysophospholipid acyltransferase family protein [Fusobacterium necrogenes]STO32313.1 1-acyl-sn-glycerol-3-phosphate acyltransferase [Fusobacterium necrogenes]